MNPELAALLDKYRQLFRSIISSLINIGAEKWISAVMIVATVYYIVVFCLYSVLLHAIFYTQAFDAGIFDQAIWLFSRLLTPFVTVRGLNSFGDHVSIYQIFLSPLFWLWDNINVLYIVQSLVLGLGSVFLFYFARERTQSSWLALIVSLAYLLYPALQNLNLDMFHPEALVLLPMLLALIFLVKEQYPLFYLFLIISLLGKEEVSLTGLFIGLYLWWFKKNRSHGWAVIGISVFWYLICSRLFMPYFNSLSFFHHEPAYSHWFQGLMNNLFNPGFYWTNIFHPESLKYYWALLVPLAALPLLSPAIFFLIIPSVAVNVLSGVGYLRSIDYHYNYVEIAILFVALVEGLRYIASNEINPRIKMAAAAALLIIFSIIFNLRLSHFPLFSQFSLIQGKMAILNSDENIKIKYEALRLVPKDAKVTASYTLVPHLSHRQEIYLFPNPFIETLWGQWFQEGKGAPPAEGHVDYVVIDLGNHGEEERKVISFLENSNRFQTIYRDGPVLVLKRSLLTKEKSGNLGVNYVLYQNDGQISIDEDFAKTLTILAKGKLEGLYFPNSNYYFRDLWGNQVPAAEKKMALELFGYMYIPRTDYYKIKIQSDAQYQMRIDGKPVDMSIDLKAGFHPYSIKYLNSGSAYNLKIVLSPSAGSDYIIPENYLRRYQEFADFSRFIKSEEEKRKSEQRNFSRAPNLVLNGGFETVSAEIPQDWRIDCWQDPGVVCSYTVDSTFKKSGKYSAKIEHRGKADSRWVQEVIVKPRTLYRLSGWIKTRKVASEGAGASLQIDGMNIRSKVLSGDSDWQEVELDFKTGFGQNKIKILCRLGDFGATNTGTAYFDEVTLKELSGSQD